MKTQLVSQIAIAASCAEVFHYLENLKYHYLWNPHLQSLSVTSALKKGKQYRSSSLLLGIKVSGTNIVTRYLLDKELEIENKTGALQYNVNYRLRSEHKETIVICTTKVTSDSNAFAFSAPVLKMLAQRELQTDLQALKIAVEQRLK